MSGSAFRLTPNFTLGEWSVSRTRPDLVEAVPDHLGPFVVRHTFTLLQPLRDAYGAVQVTSGYRTFRLNRALGGSGTSQHLRGEAADITSMDGPDTTRRMFLDIVEGRTMLPAGQVIWYPHKHFIHIALPGDRYPIASAHLHLPSRGLFYRPVFSQDDVEGLLP